MSDIPFSPIVERFMQENTCLYRHYHISEVQLSVAQFTGINLTDTQAIELVQAFRDKHHLGAIKEYNLPSYVDNE